MIQSAVGRTQYYVLRRPLALHEQQFKRMRSAIIGIGHEN